MSTATAATEILAAARDLTAQSGCRRPAVTEARPKNFVQLLGVACIVLGAKWLLIAHCGSPVPYCDQWDAEARTLFIPWLEGRLGFLDLFDAHNEHRVFFTRVLALLLFALEGRWEPRLEMAANAAVHLASALVLLWVLPRLVPQRFVTAAGALVLVLFVVPFGWENTLLGFQSQFYFLELFSLAALAAAFLGRSTRVRLFAAAGFASSALVSMASGFVTLVALAAGAGFLAVKDKAHRRSFAVDAVCFALLSVAASGLLKTVDYHQGLKAQGAADFAAALGKSLAWPLVEDPMLAPLLYAPLLVLAVRVFCAPSPPSRGEAFVLALGGWVVLEAAAMAYARGSGGEPPVSRYMDLLALGPVANFLSLVLLWGRLGGHQRRARIALFAALHLWGLVFLGGLVHLCAVDVVPSLRFKRAADAEQLAKCRTFLETRRVEDLFDRERPWATPYPDPRVLAALLVNPTLRRVLPGEMVSARTLEERNRTGLTAANPAASNPVGVLNRAAEYVLGAAKWFIGLGVVLLLLSFLPRLVAVLAFGRFRRRLSEARIENQT
jgi:hypothetical protein